MADAEQKVSESPRAAVDEESKRARPKDYWRKKWVKFTISLVTFLVIHGLMVLVLDLTFLHVRRPKYRLQSITVENLSVNSTKPPYFNMQFKAQVTVKNANFGSYKFDDSNLIFSYRGTPVGKAVITGSKAHIRSTKTMGIMLNITSQAASANPSLGGHIASGLMPVTANSDLTGKVRFLLVISKKKSAKMDCDLAVNLVHKFVQDLRCI